MTNTFLHTEDSRNDVAVSTVRDEGGWTVWEDGVEVASLHLPATFAHAAALHNCQVQRSAIVTPDYTLVSVNGRSHVANANTQPKE